MRWIVWLLALSAIGCRGATRCGTCGMKVDTASRWVAYVAIDTGEQVFDTPRCAMRGWRRSRGATAARFREYYSQEMKPADSLRFVEGSDVVGPMGPDAVPVATQYAARFAREHNGAPPKTLAEMIESEAP